MISDNLSETQPMYTRLLSKPFETLPSMNKQQMRKVREYFLNRAKKGVIMIDLDRNLTDESYDFSEDGMDNVIKEVQDKGYLVCLNSSRSARRLRYWQSRVRTHFPTFAENGLILDIPDPEAGVNMQIVTDDRVLLFNDKFRQHVLDELKDRLKEKYPNIELKYCTDEEPEDTIKRAIESGGWKDAKDEYGIYINGWTRVKTVMNAFRKTATKAEYDEGFTKNVLAILGDIRKGMLYNREVKFKSYD